MKKKREYIANNVQKCYYQKQRGDEFMLIEYRVKNFMSFRDETVLSMVADPIDDLEDTHVFKNGNLNLLKTVGIFGANASGKSNFISSFSFFNEIFSDFTDMAKVIKKLPYYQFSDSCAKEPISFEITFILNGKRHRYGIEITEHGIASEWLYFVPTRSEACYFEREGNEITEKGIYFKPRKALDYIKPDPLRPFLYTLAQNSLKEFEWAKAIYYYLKFEIRSCNYMDEFFKNMLETKLMENSKCSFLSKDLILKLIQDADFGIDDILIEEKKHTEDNLLSEFREFLKLKGKDLEEDKYETYMIHSKYNNKRAKTGDEKLAVSRESSGTQKFYFLLYPILFVLHYGGILLIDEIESSLHPRLCEKILSLFNSIENNPNNAQLIFTTHNALLMNSEILRRDQIYFVEKNKYGESNLYSLFEEDGSIRKGYNYMKNYLAGRFGAIPYLGSFGINESTRSIRNETQKKL
jgi:AAA15 family ATPase/GTPase